MSNELIKAHTAFGEPCGPDAELPEIADYFGDILLNQCFLPEHKTVGDLVRWYLDNSKYSGLCCKAGDYCECTRGDDLMDCGMEYLGECEFMEEKE